MRRLAILLVLISASLAQCDTIVSGLETSYASYLHTSVGCGQPHPTTLYANLSQLAEGYSYAAQCFKDEGNIGKAHAYYSLAAGRYGAAADALCSSDYALKANLYISSGDAYIAAAQPVLARQAYEKAISTYSAHPREVGITLYSTAKEKEYALDHPMAESLPDVGNKGNISWLPIAMAGLVFVGIGLAIVSLRR